MNRKEYLAKYREDHRQELREKAKKYDGENKEHKKDYYELNKHQILEKNKEKILCECGVEITKNGKSKHLKTKKHFEMIENKNKKVIDKEAENIQQGKLKLYDEMIKNVLNKKQEEEILIIESLFD